MGSVSHSSKSNWGLCIFILLFIFSPVLSTQETAQPGALYVVALVVPIVFMALNKGLIKTRMINLYAVLLFVFAILSTAISDLGNFRVGAFMKYLFLIVFFISTNSIVLTPKQLKFSSISYLGLSIAISLLIILSYIFGYPHNASEFYQGRYSIGITGLYKNPNYLTSFYNIAFFVISFVLATVKQLELKKKFVLVLILALLLFSSFLSGTRAALLLEILILCSIPIILAKKKFFYRIILFTIIIFAPIIYYYDEIEIMLSLFLGERDIFSDAGRTDAWGMAFKYIKSSPLLGCGYNSWYSIHGSSYLEWLHNIFLELLLDQGLIGLILFISIIASGFQKTNANDRTFLLLLFLFSSIPLTLQNGLYEVHFWRYIIINRLMMNFSTSYPGGISAFFNNAFGSTNNHRGFELQTQNS